MVFFFRLIKDNHLLKKKEKKKILAADEKPLLLQRTGTLSPSLLHQWLILPGAQNPTWPPSNILSDMQTSERSFVLGPLLFILFYP